MKKYLLLSALALPLAACGGASKPTPFPTTDIYITGVYTYMVKATESVVSVNPGKVGSQFCYTDRHQTTPLCNNLVTGQRTVPSGYDLGVVFTEPGTKQDRSVLP